MIMVDRYETKFIFKYWSDIKNVLIDLLLSIIICVFLAVVVTFIGPIKSFLTNLIVCESFGITVCAFVFWTLMIFRPG